jgi:dTDP-glucose pyrophosphorylase
MKEKRKETYQTFFQKGIGNYHHKPRVLERWIIEVPSFCYGFAWLDTDTQDSLTEASIFVEVIEKCQGLKMSCLEGIAYRNSWTRGEDSLMTALFFLMLLYVCKWVVSNQVSILV